MRIRVLKDSSGADSGAIGRPPPYAAANDNRRQAAPFLNAADTYLMTLAPGSRRTMAQALNTIAGIIQPGARGTSLDWPQVSYSDVVRVRSELASRYAPATANKILAALRGTLKAAFRLGLMDADSMARATDVPRVRGERTVKGRCLDTTEIARVIAACDQTTTLGVRNAAVVALGFGCGLRRAELVGLDVANVLDGAQTLRVFGKGAKERKVYLPAGAQSHLAAWLQCRGSQSGPLFCSVSRIRITYRRLVEQTVYDVLRTLARKAGIAKFSPHDLRRSFVSSLLDQGVSLSTVASMSGHTDVSTTSRYDRRGERVKREAARLLNVAMPAQCDCPTEPESVVSERL